jgi:CRISPR-associated protein (TIGR02584 family)
MNTNTTAAPRRILLSTAGATAQVITETLYAINKDGLPWPDEIRVITTTTGAEKVRKGLLVDGHLNRLCDELGRTRPAFDQTHILIIPDANGQPVDDARSLADHEALGDFIMTQVRDITADAKTVLHASLAGGRKTMTFYLGYAMSLFGRNQDILSHVLVSERFENLPEFWYPSQLQGDLKKTTRTGEIQEVLKSADAQVTLAQIPFMRLHQDLPKAIREVGKSIKLTDLIQRMNMGNAPESIRLRIDLPNGQLAIWSGEAGEKSRVVVSPNKLELAFYVMCHRCSLDNIPVRRPQKDNPDIDLLSRFPNELLDLCGLPREEKWADALDALEAWGELHDPDLQRSVTALNNTKGGAGIPQTFFDQRLNTLKTLLMDQLPKSVVNVILPASEERGGHYKIGVPRENITVIEPSRS